MGDEINRLLEDAIKCFSGESTLEKVRKLGSKALIPDVERKNATVYLQQWDGLSKAWINETFSPDDILNFFSDYLSTFTSCIKQHNGIIFSINESSIIALFDTDDNSEHVNNASFCALKCLELVSRFSVRWSQGHGEFNLAIGIDTGLVIMGNFGSRNDLYFNVLGQPVKTTASLVRKMAPGSGILISEFAHKELSPKFELKELDQIIIKGLHSPVKLYELIGHK